MDYEVLFPVCCHPATPIKPHYKEPAIEYYDIGIRIYNMYWNIDVLFIINILEIWYPYLYDTDIVIKTEVNPPNNNMQYKISTNECFSTASGGIYANYRSNAYSARYSQFIIEITCGFTTESYFIFNDSSHKKLPYCICT